jgi:hypothetical protein
MHTTFALAALAAAVVSAQTPAGCSPSFSGDFEITAVNSTLLKRDLSKRTCGAEGSLTISLSNGILTDAKGRTGYIASNFQFQFDGPVQAGALITSGFSACSNGSLALGSSAIWFECLSGDFFNLYDRSWAPQCQPILIDMLPCAASEAAVSQASDGQPAGTSVAVPPVTQIGDGQPQAASPIPITQIADGQPQIPTVLMSEMATPVPVSQISDGQPQAPTATPSPAISQISDGQPQAPTAPVSPAPPAISQISDGQPQAPTASPPAVISQISDGQPQAPTSPASPPPPVISQISDGQPQAPTAPVLPTPVISQISDGQPQAPTTLPPVVTTPPPAVITQISDGQPQAPNVTAPIVPSSPPTSSPLPVTVSGAENVVSVGSSLAAVAAGIAAMLFL